MITIPKTTTVQNKPLQHKNTTVENHHHNQNQQHHQHHNTANMSSDLNMFSSSFDYRITILGEPQVGKTCILNQIVRKGFNYEYVPTLETDMEYLHEYKGKNLYFFVFFL